MNHSLKYKILLLKQNKTKKRKHNLQFGGLQFGGLQFGGLQFGGLQFGGLQFGGSNQDNNNNNKIKVIENQDTIYPKEFIGYNVITSNKDNLDDLIINVEKESGYLNSENKLDYYKLDNQLLKDLKRQVTYINKDNLLDNFNNKLNDPLFKSQIFNLQPLSSVPILFNTNLQKSFPLINVNNEEINAISQIANETLGNSELINEWALIPFFDEIINSNEITDIEVLNKIKLFSQQSISKTILDILQNYVAFDNGIHVISNSDTNTNDNLSKINININNNNSNSVIVINEQLFSLLVSSNEFIIANINSSMYFDLSKNLYYLMWKLENWHNLIVEKYYNLIITKTIPKDILVAMQKYIYNNLISDKYPLLQEALVLYFEKILTSSNDNNSNLSSNQIDSINNLIENALKANKLDAEIAELIKNKNTNESNENDISESKDNEEYKSDADTDTMTEHKDSEGPNLLEEHRLEKDQVVANEKEQSLAQVKEANKEDQSVADEEVLVDEQANKDDEQKKAILNNDMKQIKDAKENLEDAYQQYQNDHKQIIYSPSTSNPNNTDNLTSGLAVAGSVASLGAIGSGLYFALPLLLGGSKKNKKKYNNKNSNKVIKKTRSNKK
jgi:hypothetical protein